ncbi:protein kinase domain-containing protein [Legionella waltersii]|uniref:Serine/threonine-protein kinase n=1 Tax=Legionella waltersii TaxID=66969 RepID=A0A0W1ANV9_9GAMM|nr:protein kinase [Legionella waltersii]KTD82952.1 serine/threonine-protein kinase [Legionella waltersii]SNU97360.1 serine/threonine-protein kinase [Legionella waltersii]
MFNRFFSNPRAPKKQLHDVVYPSIVQQKKLMDQHLPLLNATQIQQVTQQIKQSKNSPPFCLNSTPDIPFRILYDGDNTYVLSDIVLGAGGEGIMMAGQLIDKQGNSSWLAIKECFPGKEMRDMVLMLLSDERKFLENYEHFVRILYTKKHPNKDYDDLSQRELIDFFQKHLLTEITPITKEKSLQDAVKNQTILKELGIPATVFSTEMLVYFVMPLLRGNDLVTLSGSRETNPTMIFDVIIDSAKTNPDAALQWGPFVTSYAQVIDSTMEQVSELHRKNYLHRDIKPHNLMLMDTRDVQLIDFGSAAMMHEGVYVANDTAASTPGYISPQQAEYAQFHPQDSYHFTRADDLHSLGITLKELHAQRLIEAIFTLYPDLEKRFTGIPQALSDLHAQKPTARLHAMQFLSEHFNHFVQALEVKQGLLLQHDDNYEKLVATIERYRLACYESTSKSTDVSLIINGKEFSTTFAHDLLMGELSSEDIAKNLLKIKQLYEESSEISAEDVVESISSPTLKPP